VGRAGDTRLALELHRAARRVSKLLVLSSVGGDKVLPWMVSTAGNVKCFDTVSLHRHALHPITLHFLCLRTPTSSGAMEESFTGCIRIEDMEPSVIERLPHFVCTGCIRISV